MERGGPYVARDSIEAEQGQIRGAASLLWVEADGGFLLATVDGQHRRVEVEDRAGLGYRLGPESRAVPVVEPCEARESLAAAEAIQEPAERRCLRAACPSAGVL